MLLALINLFKPGLFVPRIVGKSSRGLRAKKKVVIAILPSTNCFTPEYGNMYSLSVQSNKDLDLSVLFCLI